MREIKLISRNLKQKRKGKVFGIKKLLMQNLKFLKGLLLGNMSHKKMKLHSACWLMMK